LGFFASTFQVGLYQLVVKLKGVLVAGVSSVGNVMIPRLSFYVSMGLDDSFNRLIQKNIDFLCFVGLSLAGYIAVFSEGIVRIVAGPEFMGAVVPLRLVGIVVFLTCINIVTGVQVLVPRGKEALMAIFSIVGAIVSITINVLLDSRVGALGSAIAILCAEGIIFFGQILACLSILKKVVDFSNLSKIVASLILSIGISLLTINIKFSSIYMIDFLLKSVQFWSVFVIVCLVAHEKTMLIALSLIRRSR
jgi:O-antigen/teichoic acid export membrane protein